MANNPRRDSARRICLKLRASILIGLTFLISGCGEDGGFLGRLLLKPDRIIVERTPDPAYDQLFPYYVELCALSQWSLREGGRGNPFGHAVMYLKGGCKDEQAPFPQLRRCRGTATEFDDPEHGAGVSVGRWFRNVNWVAVPGYELFYTGNLKPGERLTRAHFDATVREAIHKGVFKGVELHPGWTTSKKGGLEDFVSERSIGTDFALQFSRNVFCARVPVTEPVLDEVIAFLNDKNYEYATGEADYNWNLLADNCVHTVRNALAAANFWLPISVLEIKIRHLLNPAVPANEFVNLALLGTEGPLSDYEQIQGEGPLRDALHEFGWLPTRHGALLKTLPVHEPNDIYETQFRLFVAQSPFRIGKTANTVRLLSDQQYVDLRTNLRHFREVYDAILVEHDYQADRLASVRGTQYRRIGRLHRDYIQTQRLEVEALLNRLSTLENGPEERKNLSSDQRHSVRESSGSSQR
jgi:hypothetical protein